MLAWSGMPMKTVCNVTAPQTIYIDRAAVRVIQTIFDEIFFLVEGAHRDGVQWYPISTQFKDVQAALDRCAAIELQIRAARAKDAEKGRFDASSGVFK